jgi:hypothetical protein
MTSDEAKGMSVTPLFIDFEASSVGADSYPIEVGFSDPGGGAPISYLINPYHVEDWTDWDYYAQHEIHHISREVLREQGQSPREVAEAMNRQLAGRDLYCDGGDYDRYWCWRLFEAAGVEKKFRILDVDRLWRRRPLTRPSLEELILDHPPEHSREMEALFRYQQRARNMTGGQQHRAAVDVKYLENLYQLIDQLGVNT